MKKVTSTQRDIYNELRMIEERGQRLKQTRRIRFSKVWGILRRKLPATPTRMA
jgi:hypothetical protein